MSIIDDLRDLTSGRVRVEPDPDLTPRERKQSKVASAAFVTGLAAWMVTGSLGWTFIAMVAAVDVVTARVEDPDD